MGNLSSVADTTVKWAGQRQLPVVFTPETGSTNNDAKKKAMSEDDDFVLYLSAHQTAGRGRGANIWLDTGNGESLLSTWSFSVPTSPQAITGPRIGLALFNAASTVWPSLEWSLKAPNDLYLAGHKVGGLLVESVTGGSSFRLLIGLGLNILNHPRRFNEAEHLSKILHNAPDEGEWFQFLDELLAEFGKAVAESLQPTLSDSVCKDLVNALNANSARPFVVQKISPQGDLMHTKGQVRWTDL
jgi:BirA family biotin operon repressor/biotin-[acetyl-CoA-carboxylase] ligase